MNGARGGVCRFHRFVNSGLLNHDKPAVTDGGDEGSALVIGSGGVQALSVSMESSGRCALVWRAARIGLEVIFTASSFLKHGRQILNDGKTPATRKQYAAQDMTLQGVPQGQCCRLPHHYINDIFLWQRLVARPVFRFWRYARKRSICAVR